MRSTCWVKKMAVESWLVCLVTPELLGRNDGQMNVDSEKEILLQRTDVSRRRSVAVLVPFPYVVLLAFQPHLGIPSTIVFLCCLAPS